MTTIEQISLACPVCDNRFQSHTVAATDAFAGRQTDFRERAVGVQPLPFLVHTCDQCGYSGERDDFSSDVDVTPRFRDRVWNELAPAVDEALMTGSARYELAAKVATWLDAAPRRVGDLMLRAAWCAADEGDSEAERYFRRHAAWSFAAALETWDGVPRAERAAITYLVGELWRRIGDIGEACAWFAWVPIEIIDASAQGWLADAARQQMDAPREWFD